MTNRILLHAHADDNTVQFRTIGARVKSPRRFFVTYGELDRLKREGSIISNDIHSFVQARLDERRDQATFCRSTNHSWKNAASRTAPGTSRPSPWTYPRTDPGWCSTATGPT